MDMRPEAFEKLDVDICFTIVTIVTPHGPVRCTAPRLWLRKAVQQIFIDCLT